LFCADTTLLFGVNGLLLLHPQMAVISYKKNFLTLGFGSSFLSLGTSGFTLRTIFGSMSACDLTTLTGFPPLHPQISLILLYYDI
jgi:hypothetical protein